MFHSTPVRALLLSTIFFCLTSSAWAQYGVSLEGTVTDKNGAVVGGATAGQFGRSSEVSQDGSSSSRRD